MATKPATTKATRPTTRKSGASNGKPAAKPAAKPANKKPAVKVDGGVTIKDVAGRLDRSEKSLRASIRRIMGGAQVGKGGRYHWKSWDDKDLKSLMADLTKADSK